MICPKHGMTMLTYCEPCRIEELEAENEERKPMTESIKFWLFRFAVSVYGSWKFRIIYPYGFCDDESDRDGYEHDTVSGYFWEAWNRD